MKELVVCTQFPTRSPKVNVKVGQFSPKNHLNGTFPSIPLHSVCLGNINIRVKMFNSHDLLKLCCWPGHTSQCEKIVTITIMSKHYSYQVKYFIAGQLVQNSMIILEINVTFNVQPVIPCQCVDEMYLGGAGILFQS